MTKFRNSTAKPQIQCWIKDVNPEYVLHDDAFLDCKNRQSNSEYRDRVKLSLEGKERILNGGCPCVNHIPFLDSCLRLCVDVGRLWKCVPVSVPPSHPLHATCSSELLRSTPWSQLSTAQMRSPLRGSVEPWLLRGGLDWYHCHSFPGWAPSWPTGCQAGSRRWASGAPPLLFLSEERSSTALEKRKRTLLPFLRDVRSVCQSSPGTNSCIQREDGRHHFSSHRKDGSEFCSLFCFRCATTCSLTYFFAWWTLPVYFAEWNPWVLAKRSWHWINSALLLISFCPRNTQAAVQ